MTGRFVVCICSTKISCFFSGLKLSWCYWQAKFDNVVYFIACLCVCYNICIMYYVACLSLPNGMYVVMHLVACLPLYKPDEIFIFI